MPARIRAAAAGDDAALAEIDRSTWSSETTPGARWPADRPFFGEGTNPHDVLVAEVDRTAAGYVALGASTALASNSHVLAVKGLAVLPAYQRRGIARQLLLAAIAQAPQRGASRLTLRVLATNPVAQRLYESLGFEIEGVLRREFLIDGGYVDDVLMAIRVETAS